MSRGLPGLRRGDHVGLVVPDLEAALAFFVDVLGGSCLVRHGPYRGRPDDPDLQERQFARHPRTEVEGIAMVQVADTVVELLQFRAPDQRREVPRTSDLGGHHLAFYVEDMPAAIEHLRSHGVRVLGEPMPLPGPEAGDGALFVFALTEWGLPLELVTYPNGKAWQQGRRPAEQAPSTHPGGDR